MDTHSQDERSSASEPSYPVTIIFCGSNLYSSRLRDLDGFYLQDYHGKNLNVYTKELSEYLNNKSIRVIHRVNPGYRYFTTSVAQYNAFKKIREDGWTYSAPGQCFYLYDDEDCMYASDHFRGAILAFE